MAARPERPSGRERVFGEDEIIVSKTDPSGKITYVNDVFIRVSGYSEADLIGAPHSLIRHPEMPRAIFKTLWDTLQSRQELFAYIVNLSQNGDHYWVLAHVTPSFGPDGSIVGYHSNRRLPSRAAIDQIRPLYDRLLAAERKHERKLDALAASSQLLGEILAEMGMRYDEFVWSVENRYGTVGLAC